MRKAIAVILFLFILIIAGCTTPTVIEPDPPEESQIEADTGVESPALESDTERMPVNQGSPAVSPESPAPQTGTPVETVQPKTQETVSSELVVMPFRFTRDNFPKIDGSTSMIPLGEAIACVLLGESRESVREMIDFSRTTAAYQKLVDEYDRVSIVIAAEPDWDSVTYYSNYEVYAGRDRLMIAPIAMDALVFMVNESNPVTNLTTQQVQKIYTGEVTNWSQVGGDDVEIEAFQRNRESGSQVLMDKLVMPGLTLAPAPEEYMPGEMEGLISAVKSFDRTSAAIGYTVYYYANDMRMAEGLKILSIDGVAPNDKTIGSGEYPFLNPYFAAIRKDAMLISPERILYDWLQSDEGQEIIRREGYVPVEG